MTLLRHYRVAASFILLAFAATALLYGQLPDPMPMRWTLDGQVDGAGIAHASAPVLLALLLATCVYPVIYSYYAWRQG